MIFIYIILLSGGFFYVGSAQNIINRIKQYKLKQSIPKWVSKHGFEKFIAIIRCQSIEDENKWFKKILKFFGSQRVRGGSHSQAQDNVLKAKEYFFNIEVNHNKGLCLAGCQQRHYISHCPKKQEFYRNTTLWLPIFEKELFKELKLLKPFQYGDEMIPQFHQPEEFEYLCQEEKYRKIFQQINHQNNIEIDQMMNTQYAEIGITTEQTMLDTHDIGTQTDFEKRQEAGARENPIQIESDECSQEESIVEEITRKRQQIQLINHRKEARRRKNQELLQLYRKQYNQESLQRLAKKKSIKKDKPNQKNKQVKNRQHQNQSSRQSEQKSYHTI